jgi:methionyl-tRNA formyltransferase
MNVEIASGEAVPGTALDDRLTFACAKGAIRILKLQREGKGPMDSATFLRGFPISAGTKLT